MIRTTLKLFILLALLLFGGRFGPALHAQGTAFSYQGQLNDAFGGVNGSFDIAFTLYRTNIDGQAVAGPVTNAAITVTNGFFTTAIDFGSNAFNGTNSWLEIAVAASGDGNFETLTPRQEIRPNPFTLYAMSPSGIAGPAGPVGATGPQGPPGPVLPDIAFTTADQIFTGSNVHSGILIATNAGNRMSGTFAGDGSTLTNLNATALTGSIPAAALTAVPAASLTGLVPLPRLSGITGNQLDAAAWQLATNLDGGNAAYATNAATAALASNVVVGISITNATLSNSTFAGNGAGLTNLNATNLFGTVADARLSGNVAWLNGTNVFAGTNRFAGTALLTNANNQLAGTFTGNGARLTNLNATNVFGVLPLTALNGITDTQLDAATWQSATNLNGGNAALATNVVAGIALTNAWITNGTYSGDGGGLTNLATAALTGTVSDAKLSANVALQNGTNIYTATNTFRGVVVATNAGNQITGVFTGNGAGLTQIPASALSGTLGQAQLPAGVVTNGASGVSVSGTFIGDGSSMTNVNLVSVNSQGTIVWTTNRIRSTNYLVAFAGAGTVGVGANPHSLVAAEVNGDSQIDLITANQAANTVSVMTNAGQGTWGLSSNLPVGSFPQMVAAADVNGDGKLDLITANGGTNTLTVLTNDGIGHFTWATNLTVGNGPYGVEAADVNGDGKVDLISANFNDNTLTVLTNDGFGHFALATNLAVGHYPYSLLAADVNGDGWADLISANIGDNTLTVLTNDGVGHFAWATNLPTGSSPFAVAAADVNGDGRVDLVSANSGANTLTVLTNAGAGRFVWASSPPVGQRPASVVALDVNGDGRVDLISANVNDNTLTVLTNSGFGSFVSATNLAVGASPYSVVAVDVNLDGKVDLISANLNANTLTVLTNGSFVNVAGVTNYLPQFIGNGGGLTNLTATALTGSVPATALTTVPAENLTGLVALARLSGITSNQLDAATWQIATNRNGGNAAIATHAATAALASNVVSGISITNAVLANVFITNSVLAGDGSALTNLTATALTGSIPTAALTAVPAESLTGLVSPARLSGITANQLDAAAWQLATNLDGGNAAFATNTATAALASNVVSGISITNAVLANAFITNSVLAGDGSALTNLTATALTGSIPASALTSVPAASLTGLVPLPQLSGITANQLDAAAWQLATNLDGGNAAYATNAATAALASNVVSGISITNAVLANAFITNSVLAGDGSALTNLTATALTGSIPAAALTAVPAESLTGLVSPARLSGITGNQLDAAAWQLATNLDGGNAAYATNAATAALASNVISGISITNAFITNSVLSGNGAGLTNLSAANLTGLVPLAQLSGINSNQLDAATWQMATNRNGWSVTTNATIAGLASNVVSGIRITNAVITNAVFAGNGASLTNLSAANLTGLVPLAQLTNITFTQILASTWQLATNLNGGNAAYATNAATAALASNVVSGIRITNAVITNAVFAGNGASLTNLSAANLTGLVPLAQLTNITFTQILASTWQLATNLNGGNATYATNAATAALASNVVSGLSITNAFITNSVFAGNGTSLTNLSAANLTGLVPLAQLTNITFTQILASTWQLATNLDGGRAAYATNAATAALASNVVSGLSITNTFITNSVFAGNGGNVTNLNATNLASGTVPLLRLSGITSNQLDAVTWQLATNRDGGRAAYATNAATAALASNVVSGLSITNAFITNSVFAGNGGNVTNLNATNLASGTIPLLRLSGITSNQLDAATWQIATNRNGWTVTYITNAVTALASNVVSGIRITNAVVTNSVFAGNGVSVTNLNAANLASGTIPLLRLTGITSNQLDAATWQLATNLDGGNAATAALASNVVSGLSITNAVITNSVFAGNGSGLTNLNGASFALKPMVTTILNWAQGPLPITNTFTSHGGTLLIAASGSGSSAAGGQLIGMPVSIDGTAVDTNSIFATSANQHLAFIPKTLVQTGLPAGSHTIILSATDATLTDTNDYFNLTIQELPY